MTASDGGKSSPSDPADVRSPVVNFGVYFRSMSIGNKSPPIARMVTPLPPVKLVKNAHTTMATMAIPPGSQPTSARKSSTSLRGVPPFGQDEACEREKRDGRKDRLDREVVGLGGYCCDGEEIVPQEHRRNASDADEDRRSERRCTQQDEDEG